MRIEQLEQKSVVSLAYILSEYLFVTNAAVSLMCCSLSIRCATLKYNEWDLGNVDRFRGYHWWGIL